MGVEFLADAHSGGDGCMLFAPVTGTAQPGSSRTHRPAVEGAGRSATPAADVTGRLSRGREACVCDVTDAFELSQPTISHHLKVLHEAGLLERAKRGVWVYYRARPEALAGLAQLIGIPAS